MTQSQLEQTLQVLEREGKEFGKWETEDKKPWIRWKSKTSRYDLFFDESGEVESIEIHKYGRHYPLVVAQFGKKTKARIYGPIGYGASRIGLLEKYLGFGFNDE